MCQKHPFLVASSGSIHRNNHPPFSVRHLACTEQEKYGRLEFPSLGEVHTVVWAKPKVSHSRFLHMNGNSGLVPGGTIIICINRQLGFRKRGKAEKKNRCLFCT